ncbi:hypothetical protein GCM10010284_11150 [Streptomyces rubiginosohelvolus]|uniref:Uncharacterized protein n=1 Tax=Streptomyces rubiginosohelvolus TaxID=67362 RepID=A0ABQ3BT67_9ACTN|nr:hypothetical protein GCM10010284_11150 [Streptomyces rubiginosohelvolus]GGZ53948.1 hypothetical protein GCM10010328_31000 [Streptomyces pluricolorescens]
MRVQFVMDTAWSGGDPPPIREPGGTGWGNPPDAPLGHPPDAPLGYPPDALLCHCPGALPRRLLGQSPSEPPNRHPSPVLPHRRAGR